MSGKLFIPFSSVQESSVRSILGHFKCEDRRRSTGMPRSDGIQKKEGGKRMQGPESGQGDDRNKRKERRQRINHTQ